MNKRHPVKFFTEEERQRLVRAIREAEKKTSGEIRVHLARFCEKEPMEEAKEAFEKLGMARTAEKNGILFFLSLNERFFVILGDKGIHEKVGQDFWHTIRDQVLSHFQSGDFLEGLISGISQCGEKLSRHFPRRQDDQNELSDDISSS